jgi:hypothetical protein
VLRFLRWQTGTRLLEMPVVAPWIGTTALVMERGMTGATMNLYCALTEAADMAFALHLLRPADRFLAIGANVGTYTILASGVAQAHSITLEPIPATYASLQRNLRLNNFHSLVASYCLADGAEPSQQLRRFGNRIEVNQFSMRSSALEQQRPVQHRRVLVFGDSLVWGGAVLDQELIATELLAQPGITEVGNVAAPSWGPGTRLGYAKRFGFLDATDVVLVISSHDAADNPSPEPFRGNANHPLSPCRAHHCHRPPGAAGARRPA